MLTTLIPALLQNGMLPLVLPEADVDKVFADAEAGEQIEIDLPKQVVRRPNGEELAFDVDAFRKHCLVNGLDDINLTLQHEKKVAAFEAKRSQETPWLDGVRVSGPSASSKRARETDRLSAALDWIQWQSASGSFS